MATHFTSITLGNRSLYSEIKQQLCNLSKKKYNPQSIICQRSKQSHSILPTLKSNNHNVCNSFHAKAENNIPIVVFFSSTWN